MGVIRYVITRFSGVERVNLSRPDHWGNIPYPSARAAEQAAREDAGAARCVIDYERYAPRKGNA